MTLFSIFGGVALLLAATGLYSVVSYTVVQRTPMVSVSAWPWVAQRGATCFATGSQFDDALIAVGP